MLESCTIMINYTLYVDSKYLSIKFSLSIVIADCLFSKLDMILFDRCLVLESVLFASVV